MEGKKRAIEKKYELLKEVLGSRTSFNVEDAQLALNGKRSTTYWDLYNMVENGYLTRLQRGRFSINLRTKNDPPIPSGFAEKIHHILEETGFQYYISGIDVLLRYMQHIPDSYPAMLFVDKFSREEIEDILTRQNIHTLSVKESKNKNFLLKLNKLTDFVVIFETQSFLFSSDGFATHEKAFVDLYFEITRHDFPLPLQELSRIYVNMAMRGVIDKSKLLQAAHERSIRPDMRLIVDMKHINKAAFELANMIKGEFNYE